MPKKTLIQISTKTGDAGLSGLADGARLSKDALIFEVVGTLDELNSWLGVVAAQLNESTQKSSEKRRFTAVKQMTKQLYAIQNTLFYIGAELANSPKVEFAVEDLHILEEWSDSLQHQLADNWTTLFLLPGGSSIGAWVDIARTVCRRAERVLVTHSHHSTVRPIILQYLNRLSDFLYVLRCFVNQEFSYTEQPFIAKNLKKSPQEG
ncbi:cob(I)yrinic acid a,c-diamide adenosyltransferase [Candidatus Woesebacteria bacterium]|nr:cob(I)yrinic acid a,c-diamide adenosyltransferase [Candidatus Woesebacteria bacterium]